MNLRILTAITFIFSLLFLFSCENNSPKEENHQSAYISRVFEYVYAPGQHAAMATMADTANFIGDPLKNNNFLYLGGFGGYVIAGFDHDVMNENGADFEVFALPGASPEPAVVYVMTDTNGDGLPNETWYELKGNQLAASKRNYWVRYYKAVSDSTNITWIDSDSNSGELKPGTVGKFSSGWWWPESVGDSLTLYGTRLPDSFDNSSSAGVELWTVPPGRFTWGYAENMRGSDYEKILGGNKLDISNAIDSAGNAVTIEKIRFIKVQTGVFQIAGWLNEVSSEVKGAMDLHQE